MGVHVEGLEIFCGWGLKGMVGVRGEIGWN